MTESAQILTALCGVLILLTLGLLVRNRLPGRVTLVLAGVLTVGLVAHLVAGIVVVATADETGGGGTVTTYLAYLLAAVAAPPLAVLWAGGERSRSGTAVLLVAWVVVPAMLVRAHDVWALRP